MVFGICGLVLFVVAASTGAWSSAEDVHLHLLPVLLAMLWR